MKDGGSAFPVSVLEPCFWCGGTGKSRTEQVHVGFGPNQEAVFEPADCEVCEGRRTTGSKTMTGGISIRDYFAAKALQGMLSKGITSAEVFAIVAEWAYAYADAMLIERDK